MIGIVLGVVGRGAVEHHAWANPIAPDFRIVGVSQGRGAVAQAALAAEIGRVVVKDLGLVGDAPWTVGIGKMRDERDLVDLGQGAQAQPGIAKGLWRETQAVHARVHLEENALGPLGFVLRQPVDLLFAVHHVPQVQARTPLQVACVEHAFEQQDGAAPVHLAQLARFGDVQQREAVGCAQAFEGALQAVTVGVGLDHRPDSRIRGAFAGADEVVPEGIEVNQGF